MIAAVIAVREDSFGGPYIGFEVDTEILECSECTEAYRLRYAEEYLKNLKELRFEAQQAIESEHPKHSDKIPLR